MKTISATAFTVILFSIGVAYADDLSAALSLLEKNDFDNATPILQRLAQQNNPIAQYKLAQMYYTGNGVVEDHAVAAKFF